MRVRENPPPFTLRLLKTFVNNKSPVSTGFLLFIKIFLGFCLFFWAEKLCGSVLVPDWRGV
jgi:hypothetical protein